MTCSTAGWAVFVACGSGFIGAGSPPQLARANRKVARAVVTIDLESFDFDTINTSFGPVV